MSKSVPVAILADEAEEDTVLESPPDLLEADPKEILIDGKSYAYLPASGGPYKLRVNRAWIDGERDADKAFLVGEQNSGGSEMLNAYDDVLILPGGTVRMVKGTTTKEVPDGCTGRMRTDDVRFAHVVASGPLAVR